MFAIPVLSSGSEPGSVDGREPAAGGRRSALQPAAARPDNQPQALHRPHAHETKPDDPGKSIATSDK